jgi:hypothetical protein
MRAAALALAVAIALSSGALVPGDAGAAGCPARRLVTGRLPGVTAAHETLAYWLRVTGTRHDLDRPLLHARDAARQRALAARLGADDAALLAPLDERAVRAQVASLVDLLHQRAARGRWLDAGGHRLDVTRLPRLDRAPVFAPALHVAVEATLLRCTPVPRPLRDATDVDRSDDVNACSAIAPQQLVQTLAEGPGTLRLARTGYALGWIAADAPLSPPLAADVAAAFAGNRRVRATKALRLEGIPRGRVAVPAGSLLPLAPGRSDRVLVATRDGVVTARRAPGLVPVPRVPNRRTVLEAAFAAIGQPYDLGGAGGIDCSALLLDAFAAAGVTLPRHSADQARAGVVTVDLRGLSVAERQARLDDADARGLVLLHLPGHVALYLGRDANGVPMALHALGSYRTPCPDGRGETRQVVRRVVVSRLDLGAGTREGSLLERLDTLAVFGPATPTHR